MEKLDLPSIRNEAKKAGISHYYTGKPCLRGHTDVRATSNGMCSECARLKSLKDYHENRDVHLAKQKLQREAHPERNALAREKARLADPTLDTRLEARNSDLALRAAALAEGESKYKSLRACARDGTAVRFTKGGKCVECNRVACIEKNERNAQADPERLAKRIEAEEFKKLNADKLKAQNINGEIIRQYGAARKLAKELGESTYLGRPCTKHPDALRYTKGGGCTHCAADTNKLKAAQGYFKDRYAAADKKEISLRNKKNYEDNKEQRQITSKAWQKANIEKVRATKRKHKAKKRLESPAFVLAERLAAGIRAALNKRNFTKKGKTVDALGCTFEEFRIHIEKQFVRGMCWGRIKEIHIDHIICQNTATTEAEVLALFHYSNLMPLWIPENLHKSDKIGYEIGNPDSGISFRKIKAAAKLAAIQPLPQPENTA